MSSWALKSHQLLLPLQQRASEGAQQHMRAQGQTAYRATSQMAAQFMKNEQFKAQAMRYEALQRLSGQRIANERQLNAAKIEAIAVKKATAQEKSWESQVGRLDYDDKEKSYSMLQRRRDGKKGLEYAKLDGVNSWEEAVQRRTQIMPPRGGGSQWDNPAYQEFQRSEAERKRAADTSRAALGAGRLAQAHVKSEQDYELGSGNLAQRKQEGQQKFQIDQDRLDLDKKKSDRDYELGSAFNVIRQDTETRKGVEGEAKRKIDEAMLIVAQAGESRQQLHGDARAKVEQALADLAKITEGRNDLDSKAKRKLNNAIHALSKVSEARLDRQGRAAIEQRWAQLDISKDAEWRHERHGRERLNQTWEAQDLDVISEARRKREGEAAITARKEANNIDRDRVRSYGEWVTSGVVLGKIRQEVAEQQLAVFNSRLEQLARQAKIDRAELGIKLHDAYLRSEKEIIAKVGGWTEYFGITGQLKQPINVLEDKWNEETLKALTEELKNNRQKYFDMKAEAEKLGVFTLPPTTKKKGKAADTKPPTKPK